MLGTLEGGSGYHFPKLGVGDGDSGSHFPKLGAVNGGSGFHFPKLGAVDGCAGFHFPMLGTEEGWAGFDFPMLGTEEGWAGFDFPMLGTVVGGGVRIVCPSASPPTAVVMARSKLATRILVMTCPPSGQSNANASQVTREKGIIAVLQHAHDFPVRTSPFVDAPRCGVRCGWSRGYASRSPTQNRRRAAASAVVA
jgi:hypothetical protein